LNKKKKKTKKLKKKKKLGTSRKNNIIIIINFKIISYDYYGIALIEMRIEIIFTPPQKNNLNKIEQKKKKKK